VIAATLPSSRGSRLTGTRTSLLQKSSLLYSSLQAPPASETSKA
jgi:hypothetical protein